MAEKAIVYTLSEEEQERSIDMLKVRNETLDYLRNHGFKTWHDIVEKQDKIPAKYRGNIYAYIMFGIEG